MRISCNDEEKQDEAGMNRLCATKLGYAGGTTDDRRLVSCFGPEKEALEKFTCFCRPSQSKKVGDCRDSDS